MSDKLITKGPGTMKNGSYRKMTKEQAKRFGNRKMPKDLKEAGFVCIVSETDPDIHGWHGYRINYARAC